MGQRRVEVDERTRAWLVEAEAPPDLVPGLEDPGACQRVRGFLCFGDRDELAVGAGRWPKGPGQDLPGRRRQVRQDGYAPVEADPQVGRDEWRDLALDIHLVGKPPGDRVTQEGLELGDLGRLRRCCTDEAVLQAETGHIHR